ncbi:MAG: TfuA-related McrA-glycine thioamidation protein [Methanobacteriaceae archaeon]|nr:TfuA-related McrA-glycine thioamidation protein [Methanobacteriaceae archaeon]
MSKKVIIFTGLSISPEEASTILEADYREPVKRNDILQAIADKPDIIGIIDGVFHSTPAVSHKEIMKAMKEGITVVGGSSMGALRASELDVLGMKGIGYVYNQYASGQITSDDDVAVTFDPDSKTLLSEALVNIDYTLNLAIEEGIINQEEKDNIIQVTKNIYYPKRNYPYIFANINMESDKKTKLMEFINKTDDIKYLDAIEVLEYIKTLI